MWRVWQRGNFAVRSGIFPWRELGSPINSSFGMSAWRELEEGYNMRRWVE